MKRFKSSILVLALATQAAWAPGAMAQRRGDTAGALIAGGIIGLATGLILGQALSQRDRDGMNGAYDDVFREDMSPGRRVEWRGQDHSGHFIVEDMGHFRDRRDVRCRRVKTVVMDRSGRPVEIQDGSRRVFCYHADRRQWLPVRPDNYVILRRGSEAPPVVVTPRPVVPVVPIRPVQPPVVMRPVVPAPPPMVQIPPSGYYRPQGPAMAPYPGPAPIWGAR